MAASNASSAHRIAAILNESQQLGSVEFADVITEYFADSEEENFDQESTSDGVNDESELPEPVEGKTCLQTCAPPSLSPLFLCSFVCLIFAFCL